MCPHCAEELPDQATMCSDCRKDNPGSRSLRKPRIRGGQGTADPVDRWAFTRSHAVQCGVIAGLVTGIIARRRIKASNEQLGRLVFANIAIVLNVVSLAYFVFVIGPSLWRALMQ